VEALVQRGAQVRCLVRNKKHLGWVKDSPVEFVVENCQEKNPLKQGVKDVDQVFHLAGATTAVKEKTYFEVNALGTENLVQACIENNTHLKKFIYLSSQAAADPCRSGGKKRNPTLANRSRPMGKANCWGRNLPCHTPISFLSSSCGLVPSMGPGIKAFMLFLSATPRASSPVSLTTINISACAMFRILSERSYWLPRPKQRKGNFFSV
jgi:hypothetical protein